MNQQELEKLEGPEGLFKYIMDVGGGCRHGRRCNRAYWHYVG